VYNFTLRFCLLSSFPNSSEWVKQARGAELKARMASNGAKVMNMIRLSLALCLFTSLVAAKDGYQRLEANDLRHPASYQGQLVEVTAEVVSISADTKALHLFDAQSKALIVVSLAQLKSEQRRALILSPIHRLSVCGRAEIRDGRLEIDAHTIDTHVSDVDTEALGALAGMDIQ
jgi:hypothetical protein